MSTGTAEASPFTGDSGHSPRALYPEGWREIDGIYVSPNVSESQLDGYTLNPLIVQGVERIGAITLHRVRTSGGKRHTDKTRRIHRLYTIELNDYAHAVEITDPANGEAEYNISSFPGWTEHIEGDLRKSLHTNMSFQLPNARIISVASNGIGSTGDRYPWSEREKHGLTAMGSQRVALLKALSGKRAVIAQGTSMGTVIGHRMAEENFYGNPENGPINLAGQIWLSPALVSPELARKKMGTARFVSRFGIGLGKELILKTHPIELGGLILSAARGDFDGGDLTALRHQAGELRHGTPEEAIDAVVAEVPTLAIAGEKDDLLHLPMMKRLENEYDGHFRLEIIKGRGHEITLKAGKTCSKVSRAGHFLIERALAEDLL